MKKEKREKSLNKQLPSADEYLRMSWYSVTIESNSVRDRGWCSKIKTNKQTNKWKKTKQKTTKICDFLLNLSRSQRLPLATLIPACAASISVSLSGVSLCVSVPVGSSPMLNAPFSSLPRQELICEIIYLPVYFKHWEDTLLIAPMLYSICAGCEPAFGATSLVPFFKIVCISQAGLNVTMVTLIWLSWKPVDLR